MDLIKEKILELSKNSKFSLLMIFVFSFIVYLIKILSFENESNQFERKIYMRELE